MTLDPQARAVLDATGALGLPAMEQGTPIAAREAMIVRRRLTAAPPAHVHSVADVDAAGIPVRLYRPSADTPLPVLVYFHGGGWVIGSVETHDGLCRDLGNASGCAVASVEYRLAPEHKYPAAIDDAYAATCWVHEHADSLGLDKRRVAVGGDSAGGNLAAAVALAARDRGGPPISCQLLIYPVTDQAFDTPSYRERADGFGLTRSQMMWFSGHYLRSPADADDPLASPLRAGSLRGLPRALIVTAGYDVLRDEGERYAARLRQDGVETEVRQYPGMIHGFFGMTAQIDVARQAIRTAGDYLRSCLG